MSNRNRGSDRTIPFCGMQKNTREALGARQCADIGLWAVDSDMGSCVWRTPACDYCYNRKNKCGTFKRAWAVGGGDSDNWSTANEKTFNGLYRVRLNTRGEAFPTLSQVARVGSWVAANPNTKFWIVTRSWQMGMRGSPENWYKINEKFMQAIDNQIRIYKNAFVQASIDDWTKQHTAELINRGWNTMFFSKDNNPHPAENLENGNVVKCKKTWNRIKNPVTNRWMHKKGLCRTCTTGCFSNVRTDVHLKFHW